MSSSDIPELISAVNTSQTNTFVATKPYTIIAKISGVSTAIRFLGIGSVSNKALLEKAKSKMMAHAHLSGGKAVVDFAHTQQRRGFLPFYSKTILTATAYVVEFVE